MAERERDENGVVSNDHIIVWKKGDDHGGSRQGQRNCTAGFENYKQKGPNNYFYWISIITNHRKKNWRRRNTLLDKYM